MDLKAVEYTQQHYDRHSNRYATTKEALDARAAGPSAPLKRFHNDIKRRLIERFARGADRLLDLACGRGGDIWKWLDAGVRHVTGLDLSPGEIEEARRRWAEAAARRPGAPLTCEFAATPTLGLADWRDPSGQLFDVVTCMFALHYFFASEASLKQVLRNVAANLRPGGFFVGTVPDGRRVNECIRGGRAFESPALRVEARWAGAPAPFGSPYVCAIGDTVTGGEAGTEGSLEYLVYSSVLVGVAATVGLRPVLDYGDAGLAAALEPADAGAPLKHFAPAFPAGVDPSLARASRLFCTFVFQKDGGEAAGGGGAAAAAAPAAAAPTAAPAAAPAEQRQPAAAEKRKREDEAGGEASAAAGPSAAAVPEEKRPKAEHKRPPPRRRAPPPRAAADGGGAAGGGGGGAPPPAE